MTPELFGQITTAIGGPGAVLFLWWYLSRQTAEKKPDAAKNAAEDIEAIKEVMHRLEGKLDILLDRGSRK